MGPKQLARIERWNGLFAGILILGAALLFDSPVVIGVGIGALLAVANFIGVRRIVLASLRREGMQRAALQLLLIAKMGILFVLVFLAIRFLPINPVALAVGMSVFLISIVVESLRFVVHSGGHPDGNSEAHDGRA
jgi:hypothetical protein